MNWKSLYDSKITAAEKAVERISSGNRVAIAHSVGEPSHLVAAMVENRENYRDVEIVHMVPMSEAAYAQAGMEPYFRHNSLFVGGATRQTIHNGHGDFTPCFFSEIPNLFGRTLPLDVAMIQVSPPDKHGYCSCGVAVDYTKIAALQAPVVLAQVNRHMPRTHGDTFVHVRDLTCVIPHDHPLTELPLPKITDVEKAIGENCARLIRDGDCLQLGIGAVPDSVLLFLKDKRDLGVHSEMISDGVVELVEAGVINHARKNFNAGRAVVTFLMGTRRLYDYVDDNPAVAMYPATYVNNPFVAGKNDNLVSVNSCVQIDLLGQICSETVGTRQISAVGGQVDFVRAAALSKGGRSIIALPSTAAGGSISKIVNFLDQGAAVTTSRYDVEYVVTEYGIANLKYRTTRERACMLIDIAHPNFREQLKEDFARRFNCAYTKGVVPHLGSWT